HIVVESYPSRQEPSRDAERTQLFLLSGHTAEALEASAKSWQERLVSQASWPASVQDLAYTASVRRTHHDFRLALLAKNRQELEPQLKAWLAKEQQPGIRVGQRRAGASPRVAFVFPGQGGQWAGMGRRLLAEEPVFRDAVSSCDALIAKHTGWSVVEKLQNSAPMTDIDIVQPSLFAVMVGLAQLWRSWGIEPAAVIGHSMGEVAAAAVAGALSLEDAAAVVCHRSRLMKGASGQGLMALAELSQEEAERLVGEYEGRISVAAVNGATSVVLAGDADAVDDAVTTLETREIFCRRIQVDVASHCAHMDPYRSELEHCLRRIRPKEASAPMYSTVTREVERGPGLNASYWARNLRQTVRFADALRKLLEDGFDTFIEMNAHPVLVQSVEAEIRRAGKDAVAVGSLRRDQDERAELLNAIGALHVSGFPIDFSRIYPAGALTSLPAYPWQRDRHWLDEQSKRGGRSGIHPDLGARLESSIQPGTELWEV
ncbi:MAG: acyltransferase domain-containing protein, partial [Bryobacteraceae bacterium]